MKEDHFSCGHCGEKFESKKEYATHLDKTHEKENLSRIERRLVKKDSTYTIDENSGIVGILAIIGIFGVSAIGLFLAVTDITSLSLLQSTSQDTFSGTVSIETTDGETIEIPEQEISSEENSIRFAEDRVTANTWTVTGEATISDLEHLLSNNNVINRDVVFIQVNSSIEDRSYELQPGDSVALVVE